VPEETNPIKLPEPARGPLWRMGRRLSYAWLAILIMVIAVLADREGYRDLDGEVSVLDAIYYATVSLSTTGYGDITPVTTAARLVNVLVILPLRLFFLALLVGTTFEVLGARTREQWRIARWRSKLRDHTIVIGYGTKGRSAIAVLVDAGLAPERIVVIDSRPENVKEAAAKGFPAIVGDSARSTVLREAGVEYASRVIVSVDRDDSAVLTTLTVRQLNPTVPIAAAVREAENAPLAEHSGANSVIVSSEAAGRLLGLSVQSPGITEVLSDLLVRGAGLDLIDRPVRPDEVGNLPDTCGNLVLGVIRDGHFRRFNESGPCCPGDRLVTIKSSP
jgi:voltage-gated potassium channel